MRNYFVGLFICIVALFFINKAERVDSSTKIEHIRDSLAKDGVAKVDSMNRFIDSLRVMPKESVTVYLKKFYTLHDTLLYHDVEVESDTDSIFVPVREVKVLMADDSVCHGRLEICSTALDAERSFNNQKQTDYTVPASIAAFLAGSVFMAILQ